MLRELREHLERTQQCADHMTAVKHSFDEFELDPENAVLLRGSRSISLANKPFQVLCHLVLHPGKLITKEELLDAVWPNVTVSESSLSVSINAIRYALEDDRKNPRFIETVAKRGYKFIAPVRTNRTNLVPARHDPATRADRADQQFRVGRSAALASVVDQTGSILAGHRVVTFVTGEAGIGKTTFLEMLAEVLAERNFQILWSRCVEQFSATEAFLPLIETIQEACRDEIMSGLREMLSVHAPTWLMQMPGLLTPAERSELRKEVVGATRQRMSRELCEFVEAASRERPWLLVIEDLHWSDYATLDFLSLFAQRTQSASILIVASYRPEDLLADDHPVRKISRELQIRGRCREVALTTLTLPDVTQYIASRFAAREHADALARQLYEKTGGHPLFMVALVNDLTFQGYIRKVDGDWRICIEQPLPEGVPRSLFLMIEHQIARLDAAELRLMQASSVAGIEFSAWGLASVLDDAVEPIEAALEHFARRGHLVSRSGIATRPDGVVSGQYRFRHALYRDALYQRLPPGQKRHLHRLTAEALETAYRLRESELANVLAYHFELAGELEKAIAYLEIAAENSRCRFGAREAEAYLTRALDLVRLLSPAERAPRQIEIHQSRAAVRFNSSDRVLEAFSDFKEAICIASQCNDKQREAALWLEMSRYAIYTDQKLVLDSIERAFELSRSIANPDFVFLSQCYHAFLNIYIRGWSSDRDGAFRALLDMATSVERSGVIGRLSGAVATYYNLRSRYSDAASISSGIQESAVETGNLFLFSVHCFSESWALLHGGNWRKLLAELPKKITTMEKNAHQSLSDTNKLPLAWLLHEVHADAEAEDLCRGISDDRVLIAYFFKRVILSNIYVSRGELSVAHALLQEVQARLEDRAVFLDALSYPEYFLSLTRYHLASGNLIEAGASLQLLSEFAEQGPELTYVAHSHRLRALIALQEGKLTAAISAIEAAVAVVDELFLPLVERSVHVAAAGIFSQAGCADKAVAFDRLAKKSGERIAGQLSARVDLLTAFRSGSISTFEQGAL